MNYERINDTTLKIYISYIDIEERGFNPDEIWFSREKSEQLFWEMMDEVEEINPFDFEGPLWIQVHAVEKGIEVVVTKPEVSQDGKPTDYPAPLAKLMGESENLFDQDELLEDMEHLASSRTVVYEFNDFEHLIPLAKRLQDELIATKLFHYGNHYYLSLDFDEDAYVEEYKTNLESIIAEYGTVSSKTIHVLEEYGTVVMDKAVFKQLTRYF
ncbi:adaptor protein MecA [Chryseomicrobium excrementi]|uniref:Adapter protein MecA n=1 Tax=Chryseomicrobium excrementi TaxID=2041346 RepID=A0A2M9F3K5_9BACL|nr:adaptor protein MecA [Chryseomicrobium excrementi]PJK18043.1 adaptor protein MecA [Chryseomicrobium excrementi]